MIVTPSTTDYEATVSALSAAIERRGLRLFARFDHAAGAREAGLELADEQVLAFGNPKAGTPLMQADPRVGIELPLKLLVWSEGERTLVGYRDPRELAAGYELAGHEAILEQMAQLLEALAGEATAAERP